MDLFKHPRIGFTSQSYMDQIYNQQFLSTFRRSGRMSWFIICCVMMGIYIIINIIVTYNIRNDHFARTGKRLSLAEIIGLLLAGLLVLPVYLSKRVKGKLVLCFHCSKLKLREAETCFHCGKVDERLKSEAIIATSGQPHLVHAHSVKGMTGTSLPPRAEVRGGTLESGRTVQTNGKNGTADKGTKEPGTMTAEEIQPQQLARQEEEKQAAVNTVAGMTDSALLLTLGGVIMEANQAFKDMVGFTTRDLLGQNIRTILPPLVAADQRQEVQSRLQDAIARGTAGTATITLFSRDQRKVYGRLSLWQLKNSQAQPIALVLSVQDLTGIRQEEEEKCARFKSVVAGTADIIASLSGLKDTFTAEHQKNTAKIAYAIAENLGLEEEQARGVYMAGLVHDVGKIKIPSEILNKPAALSAEEYEIVKQHCRHGHQLLKDIAFPWPVARTVLEHHERLNGSGYPQGLPNKDIILEAKVLAVADVVEAMTHKRPYREAHDKAAVIRELREHREVLYDMKAVDTCLKLLEKKNGSDNR